MKEASVKLYNGRRLDISVDKVSGGDIYVSSVSFNGSPVSDYRISAKELLSGGRLEFHMTDKPVM